MDLLLYFKRDGILVQDVAILNDLNAVQVNRVFLATDTKRTTNNFLKLAPLLISEVPEININISH